MQEHEIFTSPIQKENVDSEVKVKENLTKISVCYQKYVLFCF